MTQSNPGATKSHTNNFWTRIPKLVKVIVILVVSITSLVKALHVTAKPHEPTTITFSGRVTDNAGKTIQGATVIAAIDQEVPEASQSDSNGVFQFQLPAAAQSLRLSVSADGYKPMETEAQIHRTGPQAIIMQPLAAAKQAARMPAHSPNTSPHDSLPLSPVQNCPNGICISGGTVDHPEVINLRDPLPQIRASVFAFPAQGTEGAYASAIIDLKQTFTNPAFEVDCDVPCEFSKQYILENGGEMMSSDSRDFRGITAADHMTAGVAYTIGRMYAGSHIQLIFTSLDGRPLKISNVRPSNGPS
jgi:hypothetical protein